MKTNWKIEVQITREILIAVEPDREGEDKDKFEAWLNTANGRAELLRAFLGKSPYGPALSIDYLYTPNADLEITNLELTDDTVIKNTRGKVIFE